MYNFVYKTTNNLNGDYYYGVHKTENLNDGYIGSGLRLWNAINKYGKSNFTRTIVQYFDTYDEALALEEYILDDKTLNDPHCYNIAKGGHGGDRTAGMTEAELQAYKETCRKSHNTPEYKEMLSKIKKEHWQREDYKNFWAEHLRGDLNPTKREDVRNKISQSMKQYYIDHPEAREELSKNNPTKREDVKQKMRHPHNMTDEGLKKLSAGGEKRRGSNNGAYGIKYKWMNDGNRNYRINLDKIEEYKSNDYVVGFLMKK